MSDLNTNKDNNWSIPATNELKIDPLLQCLILLTKFYHHPFSGESLTVGLPLEGQTLTPSLFERASERAGLASKLMKYNLEDLTPTLLPAVLLLHNKKACILEKIDNAGNYHVIQPESGGGSVNISKEKIAAEFEGHIIFVKPAYQFAKRAEAFTEVKPKHWFWGTLSQFYPYYSEIFVASFLINLFALASPLFVMNVYDRVVPNSAIDTLWVLAIGVIIVYSFDITMRLLRSHFIDATSKKIDAQLSSKIFEQMLGIQMKTLPKSIGTLANLVHSFEAVREFITSATISVLIDLPFVFIFIFVIWSLGGSLALIPLLIMPIVIIISLFVQAALNRLIQKNYTLSTEKQAILLESLNGIETIKSLASEGIAQKRWERVIALSAFLGTKLRFFSNLGVNSAIFCQQISYIIVVIAGVYKIASGDMTIGALIACTILISRATAPLTQIANLLTNYQLTKTALEALNKLMDMPVEMPKGKTPLQRAKTRGRIEFSQVNFHYPNQKTAALSNVSFKITPGEKVGILGRVGSGKSTLQRLLARLYEPDSGKILIDGIDLLQIDPYEFRRQIAYVSQDNFLFYGTLKENIALSAPYADDKTILKAAKLSGLDEMVRQHPEGFDMHIEEGGKNLSGGQRQMISIARAFLHDPNLILLDEPTSAMDDNANTLFCNNLKEYCHQRTLILITHRKSMLSLVDRLIILDHGKIIADGPKESILNALDENHKKVELNTVQLVNK